MIQRLFFPLTIRLKKKIKESWEKLFEGKNDGFNSEKKGAALWELRSEWVEEIIENKEYSRKKWQ